MNEVYRDCVVFTISARWCITCLRWLESGSSKGSSLHLLLGGIGHARPDKWSLIHLKALVIFYLFIFLSYSVTNGSGTGKMSSNTTVVCGSYEQLGYWSNNFDDFAVS